MQIDGWNPKDIGYDTGYNHTYGGGTDADAKSTGEAEHVSNAYAKAAEGNGQVVSASVTLRTGVCPECGRVYVAGGETNTTIKYPNEANPYQQERKSQDAADMTGARIDTRK